VTCSCVNTLFGDSAGDEALNGLQPVLATKRASSRAAIYNGIMNPQSPYVDANYSYVNVARSLI